MRIRTIVVDDEPLARERLRTLLAEHADIEIVSEFATLDTVREFLRVQTPELILLDIQLGQNDGFSIANASPGDRPPYIIFTTAFWEYAVRAFEAKALDYLVKPIEPARLQDALDRVRGRLRSSPPSEHSGEATADRRRNRLAIRHGDRSILISLADIDWVESVGNYVKLHTGSKGYLVRMPLYSIEEQLAGADFVRIHRKFIVNVSRVREISRGVRRSEYAVRLTDGTSLKMHSAYADNLRAIVDWF